MKFIFDITFPLWPGESVNLNFRQYQSDRNNNKFNYCLKIQSKIAAIISISILNPLKLPSNQIISDVNFPSHFPTISICQKQWQIYWLLGNLTKIDYHNLYFHTRSFKIIFKPNWYLMSILRPSPVNPSKALFPNTNLTKTIKNLLVVSKITETWLK